VSEPHRAGFVAIAGRANAGKSTLLNALIGEKLALTAPQAQTTRTSIQGVLTTPHAQIVFVDTPGIHKSDTLFNQQMMNAVRAALREHELVLFLADATKPVRREDEQAASALAHSPRTVLVPNKIDALDDKRQLLPLIETYSKLFPFLDAVPVSARTGEGLPRLRQVIVDHLPESPPLFPEDYLTDAPSRFLAAELIRGAILRLTREEVPHAVAVLIDTWEEKPQLVRIGATIYVEREGQKSILIGEKGQMLKKIGTEARKEMEQLLGSKIYLSLFVKVKPKWREDAEFLRSIDWRAMVGEPSETE
jgi:GTP-binding protein Era